MSERNVLKMQGKVCSCTGCNNACGPSGVCRRCDEEIAALETWCATAHPDAPLDLASSMAANLHEAGIEASHAATRLGADPGFEAGRLYEAKKLAERLYIFAWVALAIWLAHDLVVWLAHNVAQMQWGK